MTTIKTYLKNWKLEADGQFFTELADEVRVRIFKWKPRNKRMPITEPRKVSGVIGSKYL